LKSQIGEGLASQCPMQQSLSLYLWVCSELSGGYGKSGAWFKC
jgi:hypothetical protein